ncbi:MAG TPA: c-type cytochrome [Paracoccaceae bacterium]|nr:c-type cytochrome [Paracoccaceae bacterium]
MRGRRAIVVLAALLPGCEGAQSALAPAGHEAQVLYGLWWVLIIGAVVIWLALNGTFYFFTRARPHPVHRRWGEALILGGGVAFPTVGLAALLVYTLPLMADLRQPSGEPAIHVRGEQWWWRVRYLTPEGPIETANELRLPAGEETLISLDADEVIHSFWVPSLAGKLDMFPGRTTLLPVRPLAPGIYRGQCAELCGDGHALMAFQTIVMEPEAYAAWLEAEARPAREPADAAARRGREVFMAEGCAGCHTIRGTPANGSLGPDLTHVGSRLTIAAGTLENTPENLALWLSRTDWVKPGVHMPTYAALDPEMLENLVRYLQGLK